MAAASIPPPMTADNGRSISDSDGGIDPETRRRQLETKVRELGGMVGLRRGAEIPTEMMSAYLERVLAWEEGRTITYREWFAGPAHTGFLRVVGACSQAMPSVACKQAPTPTTSQGAREGRVHAPKTPQASFSSSRANRAFSSMRSCFIESRSRRVKVPLASVSKSIVTHHGVPISSCRR